jgi:multidrug efflux pump subunit AcrA (membrane-fusion protein)
MKRRKIIAVLAAITAAVCLISCSGKDSTKDSAKSATSGSAAGESGAVAAVEAKIVKSQAAETKTLNPYVDQGGNVEASVEVLVYPDIGGKLVNLNVVLGDKVTKGQEIASVNPSKPGTNYEISPVISPISGTVTSVPVDPGATVTTSTVIIKVGVIDELKIVVNLPERDSAKVKMGMSATVSLAALPGESLKATVSRVSPVLDSTSRTREITLKFVSRDKRVASGMYASTRIFISPLTDRVVIPVTAIITRSDENYVFIVSNADGGTVAKKTAIKTGTEVDGEVEVTSGLKAGDKVVVEGQDQLSEGKKVEEMTGSGK